MSNCLVVLLTLKTVSDTWNWYIVGLPSACTVFMFFSFFFFFILFVHMLIIVLLYFYLLSTTKRLTWWAMKNVKVTRRWILVRMWWYEDTREGVWKWLYVCDSRRKVPTIGHLRGLEHDLPMTFPEMPDGWNFSSAITHLQPLSHAFPLIIVPSPFQS